MKFLQTIALAVFSVHMMIITWVVTFSELPLISFKEKILVKTIALKEAPKEKEVVFVKQPTPPKPAPAPKRLAPPPKKVSKPLTKPVPVEKKEVSKKEHMIQRAKENLAKLQASRGSLEGITKKRSTELADLAPIGSLTIDMKTKGGKEGSSGYREALAARLKTLLRLPERGDVRVDLTLDRTGRVLGLKMLSSKSDQNKRYVEQTLKTARLPPFGKDFETEMKHTFTITLTSEQ